METKNDLDAHCTQPGARPEAVPAKSRPVSFCGFEPAPGPNGGLLVRTADKNSSAANAGILVGDEILAVNGTNLSDAASAMSLLQTAGAGATVEVTLLRDGQALRVAMPVLAKSLALDLDDLDEVVERKIAPAA